MADYIEPHQETTNLYNQAIDASDLGKFINITIVVNDRAKEIFKVVKANDLLKFRTQDDVLIVINEKILDKLTAEQRRVVVEESLASISYDTEADKLVISKPDVVTFSGILQKYTFANWNVIRECIKSLYAAEKAVEDETKAIAEKGKKEKQFKKK